MGKKQEGGDEQPPPFRLNYPLHYVLNAWANYHQHGRWPRPGGFDAQDVALVADFQTITRRFNWHIRQLADQDGGGEHDMSIDAFAGVIGNIQQSDWHAFGGR